MSFTGRRVVIRSIDFGRVNILLPWSLITSSTTPDQEIGSYTVTSVKMLRILAIIIEVYFTTLSTTATYLGTLKLQIGGSDWIGAIMATNTASGALFGVVIPIPEGTDISSGVVVRALCTPLTVTSTAWKVTIVGFER